MIEVSDRRVLERNPLKQSFTSVFNQWRHSYFISAKLEITKWEFKLILRSQLGFLLFKILLKTLYLQFFIHGGISQVMTPIADPYRVLYIMVLNSCYTCTVWPFLYWLLWIESSYQISKTIIIGFLMLWFQVQG